MTDRRFVSKITQNVTTRIMGEALPSPFGGKTVNPFRDFGTPEDANHDEWLASASPAAARRFTAAK